MSIHTQAQEYVAIRQSLRYEEVVAESHQLSESADKQRQFVEAVLHADIVRSNSTTPISLVDGLDNR